MGGLTDYIAALSINMSQNRLQTDASVSMLKKTMDAQEVANAQLIESLAEMPSPDGRGTLLNVSA